MTADRGCPSGKPKVLRTGNMLNFAETISVSRPASFLSCVASVELLPVPGMQALSEVATRKSAETRFMVTIGLGAEMFERLFTIFFCRTELPVIHLISPYPSFPAMTPCFPRALSLPSQANECFPLKV